LIFLPNDSSATAHAEPHRQDHEIRSHFIIDHGVSGIVRVRRSPENHAAIKSDALSQRTLQPIYEDASSLENCFVETNAAFKIFERKIFVRRVCAAIGQRESHKQRLDAENFPELRDDGILPPSRMSAASRLKALRNARCAASPIASADR
jgi:hypothetical protein